MSMTAEPGRTAEEEAAVLLAQSEDDRRVLEVKVSWSEARARILQEHVDWLRTKANAAEAETAQLRARLHEAEKGKTVDLDTAMKRGIRSWSAKLHIPVTRMMSRVLREEIHAALTPAPEANQEAGDGR